MYSVGDRIVHPLHGAGVIEDIVERSDSGSIRSYYVMKIPAGDMLVMIPTVTSEEIGVRPVMDSAQANNVIEFIKTAETENDSNWNKRYRDNMLRIRSGKAVEVARVVKSLSVREQERGLSTGERKMLHSARQILISEIVLAKSEPYEEAEHEIDTAVGQS